MNTNRKQDEFGFDLAALPEGVSRRSFVKWMGASLAVASFSGCVRAPREEILPHVKAPEYRVPGKAKRYATVLNRGGSAMGVVVSQIEGRPQLIEGNTLHPASLGGLDAAAQAEILNLYDAARLRRIREGGAERSREEWRASLRQAAAAASETGGQGFGLVLPRLASPSLASLVEDVRQRLPEIRLYQNEEYEDEWLVDEEGRALLAVPDLGQARWVLSFDSDFLSDPELGPRLTRDFAKRREAADDPLALYVYEPAPSLTGGKATRRRALALNAIESLALALANGLEGRSDPAGGVELGPDYESLLKRLRDTGQGAVALAGGRLSREGQEAVARINRALGPEGRGVVYRRRDDLLETPLGGRRALQDDLRAGRLERLLCLGANPLRRLEKDDSVIEERIRTLVWSASLALRSNETEARLRWSVPQAHELEAWGDGVSYEGTVSIQQPLIAPLFGGESALDVLATLAGKSDPDAYEWVKGFWRDRYSGSDYEGFWRESLVNGVLDVAQIDFSARRSSRPQLGAADTKVRREEGRPWELLSQPEPARERESSFRNAWLQELPHPISKQAWGNSLWLSPSLAKELGVVAGDWIRVSWDEGTLEGPALPLQGMATDSIALPRGYGRTLDEGEGPVGFGDASLERRKRIRLKGIEKVSKRERLALAQLPATQEPGLFEPKEQGAKGHGQEAKRRSLYPDYQYRGYAWGMVIDLDACTGCSACMIACQAENNIPTVGKEQFSMGREMNWIRLERYFSEADAEGDSKPVFQPVACMHCEKAPCEVVCPVAATTHSSEGVNEMTYNRCVGTRYCSNNCPYRARRFNFFDYRKEDPEVARLQFNPNVTVRSRGVMEKCTYCIQRIEASRIRAIRENRRIKDGEIVTACQSICPAEAIVFGDINDPASEVSKKRMREDRYVLLEEEDTRPRTSYLPVRRREREEGSLG
ncbi:4Fe-4S dicluster domain-containing protein [Pelagicoccus sp. SDUM812005]|uniref:4Fe-4S dicluster domain-containing protein n=1 Tax=Pelagicoccus sp. SDUM812005 TaxID=3041257 RepID=UPI00280FFCAC|nr:4Fe-4S dicluster domain-containing protein [Pelagicoccus sp. SDUM812005]MDQ8181070.1 4Fe-4S dicluster domain-containing protein [Pelagicoccus sp. SDUM812005]